MQVFLTTRLLVCLFVCPFESVIKKEGGGGGHFNLRLGKGYGVEV